jgi:hypothetical protein
VAYYLVDPNDRLDWAHDWEDFLSVGDSIASRIWTIRPMNEGTPSTPVLANSTGAIVVVSGLIAGRVYHLSEKITTANGLIGERTIVLRCDET